MIFRIGMISYYDSTECSEVRRFWLQVPFLVYVYFLLNTFNWLFTSPFSDTVVRIKVMTPQKVPLICSFQEPQWKCLDLILCFDYFCVEICSRGSPQRKSYQSIYLSSYIMSHGTFLAVNISYHRPLFQWLIANLRYYPPWMMLGIEFWSYPWAIEIWIFCVNKRLLVLEVTCLNLMFHKFAVRQWICNVYHELFDNAFRLR